MEQQFKEILNIFLRLVHKFHALEKMPRDFGTGELLTVQEIHVIEAIGKHPGMNITELAQKMVVTKGTISPIVSRLTRKKLVRKYKRGDNRKEVLLELTIKGDVAYHAHETFHLQIHSRLHEELFGNGQHEATPEQIAFLEHCLKAGERLVDKFLEDTD